MIDWTLHLIRMRAISRLVLDQQKCPKASQEQAQITWTQPLAKDFAFLTCSIYLSLTWRSVSMAESRLWLWPTDLWSILILVSFSMFSILSRSSLLSLLSSFDLFLTSSRSLTWQNYTITSLLLFVFFTSAPRQVLTRPCPSLSWACHTEFEWTLSQEPPWNS